MEESAIRRLKHKRLIRFWGANVQSEIIVFAITIAVIGIYLFITNSEGCKEIFKQLMIIIPIVGTVMGFGYSLSELRNVAPITMVMGGTRREAIKGLFVSEILRMLEMMIFYVIVGIVSNIITGERVFNFFTILVGIMMILFSAGVGRFVGAVSMKFGPVVAGFFCGAICGFGGFFVGVKYSVTGDIFINCLNGELNTIIWFVIVGILMYLIGVISSYLVLRKHEVKNV